MIDEGGAVVILATVNGEPLSRLYIQRKGTIGDVKVIVEEKFGYPPEAQRLLLKGLIAEDDVVLETLPQPISLMLVLLPFDKAQALVNAVNMGQEAAVRSLLFRVARDPKERNTMLCAEIHFGLTVLQIAASAGHSSVCRVLLEAASSVETQDKMLTEGPLGCTAVSYAAQSGHEATCRALLAAATTAEVRSQMLLRDGYSAPLLMAAGRGHEAACNALLAAAPSVEERCQMLLGCRAFRPLHAAAKRGHKAVCQALLEGARNSEVRNSMSSVEDDVGRTVAEVATEACRELLEPT